VELNKTLTSMRDMLYGFHFMIGAYRAYFALM
jgi:hypothetical protein